MNNEHLLNVLEDFLRDSGVKIFTINGEVHINRKEAYSAIINSINETLAEGDITDGARNEGNFLRYVDANRASKALFINPISVEVECMPNLSFASTTIICEHFGFDVENPGESIRANNKECYQGFVELVDFLQISSGAKPTEIVVTFTVNNVWEELG